MPYPHHILIQTEKPARYTGGESGAVIKDAGGLTRFCLCFPDVYEVGMSWSGINILYYMLNDRADVYCERAFAPWPDMEALLKVHALPMVTLETGSPLSSMDIIGFTLQHEMCYTNLLNILDLSGILPHAAERGEDFPIVCAGGPCACNPEPLADFIDFFYIGEAEASLCEVMDVYADNKARGGGKDAFLCSIAGIKGIYVPKFYDVSYNADGSVKSVLPNTDCAPAVLDKAAARELDSMFTPVNQLVPSFETVHERAAVEVFRGCVRGCRFCQAGYIYRPFREKSPETLINQAKALIAATGYDELSLLSLSTGDYSRFKELSEAAMSVLENVSLSLPSLRVDAFSLELMGRIAGARKSGLTFAPEAGSQRLRDIINKNLTEDEILNGCRLAFEGGWTRVKLYFMLGLPYETDEDVTAIAELAEKIAEVFYSVPKEKRGRDLSITLSASCFVPKPHTPFQYAPQASLEALQEKQRLLKRSIKRRQVRFTYHSAETSALEGALSRGDRRTGKAVYEAFKLGARFDSWSEHFNYGIWKEAFDRAGLDTEFYSGRVRGYDEVMPWAHINMGVSGDFLIREMERARKGLTTPNCRESCSACGANALIGGVLHEGAVCHE